MSAPQIEGDSQEPKQEQAPPPRDPSSMTVLEHLAELRKTLLWALAMAFGAAILAWFFSDHIVDALLRPAHDAGQQTLYFQKPMEAFMLKLKSSAVVGLFLVFPLILHRIYLFVAPGLLPKEKRVVMPLVVASTLLFYTGVGFCFTVLLPLVIRFALGFATEGLQPWLTAESYFDMAARLCFAFGILFELPMVVFVLSWVGLVDPRKLLRGWRYALVMILIVSAVLTPPDVISQILLTGPVMLLYVISLLVAILVRRRRDRERDRLRLEDEAEQAAERAAELAARREAAREATARRRAEREQEATERAEESSTSSGDPDTVARLDEAPDPPEDGVPPDPPWVREHPGSHPDPEEGNPPRTEPEDDRAPEDEDPQR